MPVMAKQKDTSILLYPRTMELPAQPQTADLRTSYSQEKPPSIEFTPLLLLISATGSHMQFPMTLWPYTADGTVFYTRGTLPATCHYSVSRRLDTEFPTERNYNHFALRGCKVRTG